MATIIQVLGEPGSGKTYGVKTLNPAETYYINCDKKGMPFKGWREIYSTEKKNYLQESDVDVIFEVLRGISDKKPEIKNIVIDTLSSIMSDKEMNERKLKGYDKWLDLAGDVYDLYRLVGSLRPDLIIFTLAHVDYYQTAEGIWKTRLKTVGNKLTKLNIEGLTTYTLYTKVTVGENYDHTYALETTNNGNNTGRSPEGCFKPVIDNDFGFISKRIREYEGIK